MNNGEKGIHPQTPESFAANEIGLTKREHFAAMAMQGLLSGRTEYEDPVIDVRKAIFLADALLKELDK